jgi:hypothetical protein
MERGILPSGVFFAAVAASHGSSVTLHHNFLAPACRRPRTPRGRMGPTLANARIPAPCLPTAYESFLPTVACI